MKYASQESAEWSIYAPTHTAAAPQKPPSICAAIYRGTLRHGNPLKVAKASVTCGSDQARQTPTFDPWDSSRPG